MGRIGLWLVVAVVLGACSFQGMCIGNGCVMSVTFGGGEATPTREVLEPLPPGSTPTAFASSTPMMTATHFNRVMCNITTGTYNVRSSPQIGQNIIDMLRPDECVTVDNPPIIYTDGSVRWVQVFIDDGNVGFVSAAALGL